MPEDPDRKAAHTRRDLSTLRTDVRPDTVLTSQPYVAGQLSAGSAGEVPPPCLRHSPT